MLDTPLCQPPSGTFKGDSKAGREGSFLIENREAFRHACPDSRWLWGKTGEGQPEAKHPTPRLGVQACHSLLGPKQAARNEDRDAVTDQEWSSWVPLVIDLMHGFLDHFQKE